MQVHRVLLSVFMLFVFWCSCCAHALYMLCLLCEEVWNFEGMSGSTSMQLRYVKLSTCMRCHFKVAQPQGA